MTNFIIFNLEETRAESLCCYGHPYAHTPNFDRFAAEGVRFDNCFVQHTVCTPSRCSFATGWYPRVRGHRTLWHLLRPDEPNLFKYLRDAGYHVCWYGGKNDMLATASFLQSVHHFEAHDRGYFEHFGSNPYTLNDPRYHSFLYAPYAGPIAAHGDYANVQAAIAYLRGKPQEPFVLFLPTMLPHPPYSAPLGWHDLIDPDALPPLRPAEGEGKPAFHAHIRRSRRLDAVDEAHLRKIQAVYLGMLAFVDDQFGKLLKPLGLLGRNLDCLTLCVSV